MAAAQAKLRRPQYGTMDRDAIWREASNVLVQHFGSRFDVHVNDGNHAVTIIDRAPGNPDEVGGSRCVTIQHNRRGTTPF